MSSAIHKCPSCGAYLTFDAGSANVSCEYCKSEFSVAEVESFHETAQREKQQYQSETHGYHCENCGAEVITDNETSSGFCYYCHSPVIFSDKISGAYLPDYIIPFKISKKQAQQTFRNWVKKFKLVPKGFASPEQLDKITGIYVPYWLVDANVAIDVSGTGDVVTTRRVGDKEYTNTMRYSFERKGNMVFQHVKTIASDRVNGALIDSVESNTKDKLVPFSTAYLSGFFSQHFTISREDAAALTEQKIDGYVTDMIMRELNYQNIQYQRQNNQIKSTKWSYVLLPMWILTYKFGDKVYVYALNGENGESFGQLPVDYLAFGLRALAGFVGIAGLLLLGGKFIW